MVKRFALITLLALALLTGFAAAIPSVRAQVQERIEAWFHFQLPGGRSGVGIGWGEGERAFPPYLPEWLPEGLDLGLTGGTTVPGAEYVEFEIHPMPRRRASVQCLLAGTLSPGTEKCCPARAMAVFYTVRG